MRKYYLIVLIIAMGVTFSSHALDLAIRNTGGDSFLITGITNPDAGVSYCYLRSAGSEQTAGTTNACFTGKNREIYTLHFPGYRGPVYITQCGMSTYALAQALVGKTLKRSQGTCDNSNNIGHQFRGWDISQGHNIIIHSWNSVNVTGGEPADNVLCTASKSGDIAFGELTEKAVDNATASTNIIVECSADASVRIRHSDALGWDKGWIWGNIFAYYNVGGYAGAVGGVYKVKKGIPYVATAEVRLNTIGAVEPGKFEGLSVVKIEVQ